MYIAEIQFGTHLIESFKYFHGNRVQYHRVHSFYSMWTVLSYVDGCFGYRGANLQAQFQTVETFLSIILPIRN